MARLVGRFRFVEVCIIPGHYLILCGVELLELTRCTPHLLLSWSTVSSMALHLVFLLTGQSRKDKSTGRRSPPAIP
jgi:hypothetical protein